MIRRQAGQAFILVLILLAIGALLVVPALRLTGSSLKSSQIVTRRARLLYAADAMQEYVISRLLYDTAWRDTQLAADGDTAYLYLDLCGVSVNATVVMRAVPGQGGVALATDDVIQPTKTVTASNPVSTDPLRVDNDSFQTFTYIIRLEQLSNNNTAGLDAVYDILPKDFGTGFYVNDSSYIRVDGGPWQFIANPLVEGVSSQTRLRWPASGNFTSPIRDFNVRQVKELKFQIALSLPPSARNSVQGNWVVLKPWDSTSGPQAPIIVGTQPNPYVYSDNGLIVVTKTANPDIILPGVVQDITYTVNMTSQDGSNHKIVKITDYLPPEFFYANNSTSGISTANPTITLKTINGVPRQELVWSFSPQVDINSGATITMTFQARTTKDVSGSYYNEVMAEANFPSPPIFDGIGIDTTEYQTGYSWNSGAVVVPAYDSETQAGDVVLGSNLAIDANLALLGQTSMAIISYQIR
ncbi:MAG: hypothetical protein HYU85_06450 [Chloroflexi bacterium]|nr:hypothetical protein [Chloroflexota bacterium]MBI3931342.1 hypothetical protein [Chloroflexota bacterium]